jgi:hypothetical protein
VTSREKRYHFKWYAKGVPNGKKNPRNNGQMAKKKNLGMPIYATFGNPLFLMLPNYVPNGNIMFHGTYKNILFISKPKRNLMKTQRGALLNTKTNKSTSKSFNIYRK